MLYSSLNVVFTVPLWSMGPIPYIILEIFVWKTMENNGVILHKIKKIKGFAAWINVSFYLLQLLSCLAWHTVKLIYQYGVMRREDNTEFKLGMKIWLSFLSIVWKVRHCGRKINQPSGNNCICISYKCGDKIQPSWITRCDGGGNQITVCILMYWRIMNMATSRHVEVEHHCLLVWKTLGSKGSWLEYETSSLGMESKQKLTTNCMEENQNFIWF